MKIQGQRILFATPNQRREIVTSTPSSIYSEPARNKTGNRQLQTTMSPAYMHLRVRSPDHHGYPKAAFYNKHPLGKQSKLPHGLTVQELKEMTRARLAAEAAEGGPDTIAVEKEYNDYSYVEISSYHSQS